MDEFGTWQNINRAPKFLGMDARTPFLFAICVYFPGWISFGLVACAIVASGVANYKGISLPHLIRMARVRLWQGRSMIARPAARRRYRM